MGVNCRGCKNRGTENFLTGEQQTFRKATIRKRKKNVKTKFFCGIKNQNYFAQTNLWFRLGELGGKSSYELLTISI
jgi:hypothetical protein